MPILAGNSLDLPNSLKSKWRAPPGSLSSLSSRSTVVPKGLNPPKISSPDEILRFSPDKFLQIYLISVSGYLIHFKIQNLSKCEPTQGWRWVWTSGWVSRYDQLISRLFKILLFWRIFAIWSHCALGGCSHRPRGVWPTTPRQQTWSSHEKAYAKNAPQWGLSYLKRISKFLIANILLGIL